MTPPQNGLRCYCHAIVSHCSFGGYGNFRPVSGLPSDYPYVGLFWIQNDGAVVTVMRTVETRMIHTGDAARVSDVRSFGLGVSGSCAEVRAAICAS